MKRAKYVLLVLFLLLVVITVIELKTCIHIDDSSINHKFIFQKVLTQTRKVGNCNHRTGDAMTLNQLRRELDKTLTAFELANFNSAPQAECIALANKAQELQNRIDLRMFR